MSNKKITPNQMRKNLAYVHEGAPDFMRMLTGQSASSAANNDPRNPYRKPIGIEAKFQSEQNDDDDDDETAHDILNEREEERPTVVVLKDGKHLDERQVKNILNNLPAGLSGAEIEKRLADALEYNATNAKGEQEEEKDSEDDQEPVDANGKILFRRPKGSKSKTTATTTTTTTTSSSSTKPDMSITSTASKKNFENILLAEAEAKVQTLKKDQQSGSKSSTGAGSGSEKGASSEGSKRKASNNIEGSGKGDALKKKKTVKKTTTSLLSFDEDE